MMPNDKITFTLLADGSSDKVLIHIIRWLLNDLYPKMTVSLQFADFTAWRDPPKTLKEKIFLAYENYPCDVLFIHRDAEKNDQELIQERKREVANANPEDKSNIIVVVVPIRMTEAWLLIDAEAIKKAAGNRHYKGKIVLPRLKDIEKENDPKKYLLDLLKEASGLKGRQLSNFNGYQAIHWVAEYIETFEPLRELHAFKILEKDLKTAIGRLFNNNTFLYINSV